ncbi:hypothetical protein SAMN05216179_1758 [Gracilibacillus kekensis]|uniref:Uncharacterized protein n=1 Tax=Gracilibacillus kekensis TaxID=1027249 RepID=A0A1M7NTU0_9BACI|nr:hypothetical protein SAMN05216179_1758 [Gracilibacillus kekensis]
MSKRWKERKKRTRKYKKDSYEYTKWDMFLDMLFLLPELLFWPIRLLILLIRTIGRFLGDIFSIS